MPLNQGDVVHSRYRVARLLGQGGMGAVYRAWDLNLKVPVALKEMRPDPTMPQKDLGELRQQFQQEARVLAGLVHSNLPRVTDYFEWNNNSYLVMDFIEGESLSDLLARQGSLPEQQVLNWAVQLLSALEACHERNIVHRDIKPHNIIICQDGRAVLVDFGLVKLGDPKRPQTQRIIQGMGTPDYASPEHFGLIPNEHTQPRSDLYSLGATLYHVLSGHEPPTASDRFLSGAPLTSLQRCGVKVHQNVDAAITQALSIEPEKRFANAWGMSLALQGRSAEATGKDRGAAEAARFAAAERPVGHRATERADIHAFNAPIKAASQPVQLISWQRELTTALGMAWIGMLLVQSLLFGDTTAISQYIGLSVGALLLGGIGWFVGDTIFQALTLPAGELTAAAVPGARPTQRLVVNTRKLMRGLTPLQQGLLLAVMVAGAVLAAWFLGPIVLRIPFLWLYLPSYAFAAPLAYAATGRRVGMAGLAHILVASLGGAALRASTGLGRDFSALFLASVVSALAIEVFAWLANRTWLNGQQLMRPRELG